MPEPAHQEARLPGREVAVHQRGQLPPLLQRQLRVGVVAALHIVFDVVVVDGHVFSSSSGANCASITSRARKIRERTVPIGQFITSAISS